MPINEAEARRLWELQLGQALSDDDWELYRAVILGADEAELIYPTPQAALDALSDAQAAIARLAGEPTADRVTIDPPRGWFAYQKRRVEHRFSNELYAVRVALGLQGRLLQEQDIPSFLEHLLTTGLSDTDEAAERGGLSAFAEQVTSDAVRADHSLAYWHPVRNTVMLVPLFTRAEWQSWCDYYGIAISNRRTHNDNQDALDHLRQISDLIESFTGMTQPDAVRFILCGGVPNVPWVYGHARPLPDEYEDMLVINVGSLAVEPDEVASAYRKARDVARSRKRVAAVEWAFARVTRQGEQVVTFCKPRRDAKMKWDEIFKEWNAAHPEQAFDEVDTLSRYYRRQIDKLQTGKQ